MGTIDIKLSKPQLEFTRLRCKWPLFKAGLGAGKTTCLCINAILATETYIGETYGIYEPTYRLLESVIRPELEPWLDKFNIGFKYNKNNSIYELDSGSQIRLVSMENLAGIVGFKTLAGCGIDEIEQLLRDKQDEALKRCNARVRGVIRNGLPFPQRRVYTTPDCGTAGITWEKWGSLDGMPPDERAKFREFQYVTASSESNPHTGEDYVENLKSMYFGKARNVYVYGMWENLQNGLVYTEYERVACRSTETVTERDDRLFVGMDFNVGNMAAIVHVRRPNPNKSSKSIYQYHAVREFIDMVDTPSMITKLKQEYPNKRITVYPDCAGASRKSVDASISDITLLERAGYECCYHRAHPPIKDRVLAMNRAFGSGDMKVNDALCPRLAKCLIEQAYETNGEPSKTLGLDHPVDAQGYLVEYTMPIRGGATQINYTFGI